MATGGPNITITISAENKAAPTIQEVRADFKGLAEEIAKAMREANEATEREGSKLGSVLKGALSGALSVVSGIAGAIGSAFSGAVKLAGSILGGLVDIVKGIVGGIIGAFKLLPDALGVVFNKVTALAVGAFGFVAFKLGEAAASSEAMGQALDRLAKKAGTSSNAIVTAIKRGSGETITRLDAMRVANEALIANLALTPAQFEVLAGTADLLADAVGGDTAEAFAQLVKGIRAGNDRLLEAVGINIEAQQSYEAFAASLGKSVADLTEAEKSQALLNEVLREGKRLLDDAQGSADLLGDAYDRITVLLRDGFTSAADAARGGLLSVAEAIEPILLATKAWIDANQELIASKVGEFAEGLAEGIERFANKLPEIVELVGGALSTAFDLAARAGSFAWAAITNGIGGAIREFEIFREAFVGLLEGRGFSAEGSVLLQSFRVIKTQAAVLAAEAAEAFTRGFADSAVGIANFAIEARNVLAEVALQAKGLQNDFADAGDFITGIFTRGSGQGARNEAGAARDAALAQQAIDATPRSKVDAAGLLAEIEARRATAQQDADVELQRLGYALEDAAARGAEVRATASQAVGSLTGTVTEFFKTDAEKAAEQAQAAEAAGNAVTGALQTSVQLSRVVVDEALRQRREAEKAEAELRELIRQMAAGPSLGSTPYVPAGG